MCTTTLAEERLFSVGELVHNALLTKHTVNSGLEVVDTCISMQGELIIPFIIYLNNYFDFHVCLSIRGSSSVCPKTNFNSCKEAFTIYVDKG